MESVVLCRYGELFLKSGNRRALRARARRQRPRRARRPAARARRADARPAAGAASRPTTPTRPAARLTRVFGLVSLSVARAGRREGRSRGDHRHGRRARRRPSSPATRPASFKIEARRADKRFPPTSMDIARHVGARVQAATGLPVDVHTPALRLGIEVGTDVAYVFAGDARRAGRAARWARPAARCCCCRAASTRPSPGWLAAKRGLALDAVYFHSPPYIGEKSRDKVLALGKQLARWQALRSVTVVPFTDGAEAAARRRPRRAGRRALPAHDDAHRRRGRRQAGGRRRWSPARTWARSPARRSRT